MRLPLIKVITLNSDYLREEEGVVSLPEPFPTNCIPPA